MLWIIYKSLHEIDHITIILLSKYLQLINRIKGGIPESYDFFFLHLSNPVMVATISFLLPIPEIIMGIQRELSKMSCMTSKTTNITLKNQIVLCLNILAINCLAEDSLEV